MTTYVTTFYSFKGGVGRTTLLVNVANVLAARGLRVLIWDLDLEAPGVHLFPGLEPPDAVREGGFLEWLGSTPPCPTPEPTATWLSDEWLTTLCRRVYDVPSLPGALRILPAHGTHTNLGKAYAAVDWHALFVEEPAQGLHLLRRVCEVLSAQFAPDFLLIDSRTGISDLGGILTGLLPACTVLIGNYGRQSTEGLRSVYLALDRFSTHVQSEPHRDRKLDRVLVASPVPTAPDMRERGRERWSSGFPGVAPRSLIEIPMVESLLYAEDLLVRSAPSSDAAHAYEQVAIRLLELEAASTRTKAVPRSSHQTGIDVARELMELLGFELGPTVGLEFFAKERGALVERAWRVMYRPGTVTAGPGFRDELDHLRPGADAALLIVEAARPEARWAAEQAGVEMKTLADLEDQLVDRDAYLAWVWRAFEDSELARSYVPPNLEIGEQTTDALAHAVSWATGSGPPLMLLIGSPGSGKTSFLARLAYELATDVDREPRFPLPVLIDLRQVSAAPTLASILQHHFGAAIGWHGRPEALLHLWNAGKLVMLMDGFDDMPISAGASRRLRWLTASTTGRYRNRMMVTMRPNGEVQGLPGAQVATMAPFDAAQLSAMLARRSHAKAALGHLGPADLARFGRSPLLVDLIAKDDPDADNDLSGITMVTIYDRYVARWIERSVDDSLIPPAQRLQFFEEVAVELWSFEDIGSITARMLLERFGLELALEQLERELRIAPFVVVDADGGFRFSHASFLDYFLAHHLVRCARRGVKATHQALGEARLTPGATALMAELLSDAPGAHRVLRELADRSPPDTASENARRVCGAIDQHARWE